MRLSPEYWQEYWGGRAIEAYALILSMTVAEANREMLETATAYERRAWVPQIALGLRMSLPKVGQSRS
jgi:hypothetical protein